jgi:hypothetical protein
MNGLQKMKRCSTCFQDKMLTEFYNNSSYGKQSVCILCQKAYFKAWREARKDKQQSVHTQSKTCLHCRLEKPISQFGKRAINLDKKNIYCKECWRKITYAAQKRHKAKHGIS